MWVLFACLCNSSWMPFQGCYSVTSTERTFYGKPNVAIFNSFNFIPSFVFCIQPCVQYSTCIQHSTRYSIFNFPFNIQLFILYSILHSPIQLSIQQFPLFIQHSTLIFKTFNCSFNIQLFIQHSTIHSTFNYSFQYQLITGGEGPGNEFIFPEPSLFLVSYSIRVTISFPRFTIDRFINRGKFKTRIKLLEPGKPSSPGTCFK